MLARTFVRLLGILGIVMMLGTAACVGSDELDGVAIQAAETPPAPTNLVATVVSSTQVNLSWDPVANADYYVIMKGTAPGNETTFTSTSAASATFTDDHLSPGTQYSWQVKVVVLGGTSGPSNEQVVTTLGGLAPPTGVTATTVSTSRISVSFTPAAGAVKYYVYQAQGAGPFAYVSTVSSPGTSYLATGLATGTTYSFKLQSVDSAELVSADSNIATATTLGSGALPAPTGVTATAISSSRIVVSWGAVTGAVKYYVYQAQGAGPSTYLTTVVAPGTSFTVTGLAASTTYSYVIQAVDAADIASADSTPPATATTFSVSGALPAPTGVTAAAISSSRIEVNWNAVPGAVKYYVFQAQGAGPFNYVSSVVSPSTTYTATGLAAATTYSYVVQAVDATDLASVDSAPPATATTFSVGGALPAPTGVNAMAISTSRIVVTWNAVPGAVKYYVFQAQGAGPSTYVSTVVAPGATYTATGLAPATTYSYVIQAVDAADLASPPSAPPASATTFSTAFGARYKFDDQMGGTAADSVGGHTGSLLGAATFGNTTKAPLYDEDFHNYSYLSIPGGASDAVSVVEDTVFQLTGDFSISLWARLPSGSAGTIHLLGKRAESCGAVQYDLYQDATGLHFANDTTTVDFGQGLAPATWTQIGITHTGTTATLYVNGAPVASGTYTVGPNQPVPLQIGNSGGCGNGAPLLLDEVRFYSAALTAGEMATLGTPPPAPANMTGVVASSTEVNLSWDPVPNADLYVIFRGSAAGNETVYTSLSSTTLTFQEGHLVAGQTTSWQIRAVVDGLISAASNEVVLTTNGAPPPPSTVTATLNATDNTRIEVSWSAVTDAQKYYIYRSINGGTFTYLTTVVAPGMAYSDAGLASGTNYAYQIVTVDTGNTESAPSASASASTP